MYVISGTISNISRFSHDPRTQYRQAVMKIFRYIKGIEKMKKNSRDGIENIVG